MSTQKLGPSRNRFFPFAEYRWCFSSYPVGPWSFPLPPSSSVLASGHSLTRAWFLLFLLLRCRRLRSPNQIFRFHLRLATDMRYGTEGAYRGKGVPWRLTLVHVLWQGEGRKESVF